VNNLLPPIKQWHSVDLNTFEREILPANQPSHIKALIRNWPVVRAAIHGNDQLLNYLLGFDNGEPVYTIVGPASINGRFFYNDTLNGTNFQSVQAPIAPTMQQLYHRRVRQETESIAVQAAEIRRFLPGFQEVNAMPLLPSSVEPTLWLNNRARVATHFDTKDNIACVVAGRRTFTLFPPEQAENLYIGPTMDTPGGVPISMVDLASPDLDQFPNFSKALNSAQQATLEPGDAIFIPTTWWHAVESLDEINLLINYWWA